MSRSAAAHVSRRFRRVLVALDWSSENTAAAEAVTALAARLRAELRAMFVEDIDLLRLAEHPDVYAFSMLSARGERLAADQLQRVLRSRLARSRRAIEEAASRRQLACAFEVRQGRLLAEALGAAGDEDLVIMSWSPGGPPSWITSQPAAGALARALAELESRSVLLLHPDAPAGGPVLIAYDASAAAKGALNAAAQIADEDGGAIEVALLSGRVDDTRAWAKEIADAFAGSRLRISFVHLPKRGLEEFCRLAALQRASLMVLSADLALSEPDASRRALERVGCSVLLVR
jgi:nucleotide-binding universal stress UspA family protein